MYLKIFEKIYAPLTAGLLNPFAGDKELAQSRVTRLDKLYRAVVTALDNLCTAVGIKAACVRRRASVSTWNMYVRYGCRQICQFAQVWWLLPAPPTATMMGKTAQTCSDGAALTSQRGTHVVSALFDEREQNSRNHLHNGITG
jgi:hypothetical protein